MKVRILKSRKPEKPGDTPFHYPVVFEPERRSGVFVQIEYKGESYTFEITQQEDGISIRTPDAQLVVEPWQNNRVVIKGPADGPGKYEGE